MRKMGRFQMRVYLDDKAAWEAAAKEAGKTVTEFVTEVVNEAVLARLKGPVAQGESSDDLTA